MYPQLVLPMRTTHLGYIHGQRNNKGVFHPGYDLNYGATPNEDDGRLCIAPTRLKIVHIDRQPYYGRTVVGLSEEHGLLFRMLHCSKILAPLGTVLEAEEYMARCGKDDGSANGTYHKGMSAHLHYDIMNVEALHKHKLNYMVWGRAVSNRAIFDEVFVDPKLVHPALEQLLQKKNPYKCTVYDKVRAGQPKYDEYLR